VLVVDDNRDAADTLRMLLRLELDAEVACAYASDEAIESAASFRPDVCILDIGLPTMDGYRLAELLRERFGPKPLLIACTGYGQSHEIAKALRAGFDHHLLKPCSAEQIVELIRKASIARSQL
jgi:CheY-like chemotaxis protein